MFPSRVIIPSNFNDTLEFSISLITSPKFLSMSIMMVLPYLRLLLLLLVSLCSFSSFLFPVQCSISQSSLSSLRLFSSNEISSHSSSSSCYVIINGFVYDFTSFLPTHIQLILRSPYHHDGNHEKILPGCGQDVTYSFMAYHGRKVMETKTEDQIEIQGFLERYGEDYRKLLIGKLSFGDETMNETQPSSTVTPSGSSKDTKKKNLRGFKGNLKSNVKPWTSATAAAANALDTLMVNHSDRLSDVINDENPSSESDSVKVKVKVSLIE